MPMQMVEGARHLAEVAHPPQQEQGRPAQDNRLDTSTDNPAARPMSGRLLPAGYQRAGRSQFRGTVVPYAVNRRGLHDHTQASGLEANDRALPPRGLQHGVVSGAVFRFYGSCS